MAYQGWKNYETWVAYTWITNEQQSYRYAMELAERATRTRSPRKTLSDALKDDIEEGNPVADESNLYADLMGAAIGEIDWYELADAFLEEVEE